ncbi:hypothetical protein MKQ70_09560 [Chitinophaga sedimenti]|uniref:hypothetical protein n=1 Tax=Chitinophaga sedimenti TaxID=2033606 RepID=UPI0020033F72|nr:hypothetical protein [Chitinophaga sedimenti]MCK7555237.1 hypothetical protein [Chitinophaga sedimenti]
MLKKLLFLVGVSAFCLSSASAQSYRDVLDYYANFAPTHGVKIKTNFPFENSSHMPTIIIEGYAYNALGAGQTEGVTINLMLTYYVYDNGFINSRVSSAGGFTPPLYLASENGKVVIYIDSKVYFQRFHVKAYEAGFNLASTAFDNWTAVDELPATFAAPTKQVNYQNTFAGMVGIGVGSPSAPLHVVSTTTVGNQNVSAILGNAYNHWTVFGGANGGRIRGSNEGYLDIESSSSGSNTTLYLNTTSPGNVIMSMQGTSNVGIGTGSPQSKLAVAGTITAQKVRVTSTGWPDYVFEPAHVRPSLPELSQFLTKEKHLPGIPTAAEITAQGHDVGEMNKKLLEKVEELTLYLIEEHKARVALEEKVKLLEQRK